MLFTSSGSIRIHLTRNIATVALGGLSLLLASAATFAQDRPLEEITVTAQKREESLQQVPITMQAYSGEELARMGVTSASEVVKLAPNLNVVVQNALSHHIIIRGVGTNEFFGNAASSVGMYLDEVTMASSYMSTLGLFDMERVEILRGPQNSLFGRNTTGGAVNYISRQPEAGTETEGYASLRYGIYNLIELEAAASFALGETAAVRLAGVTRQQDGRWNNITEPDPEYGDIDQKSFRGTLVWEPSEATKVTAAAYVARDRSEAWPQKAFGTTSNADLPISLIADEQTIFGNLGASDIDFNTAVPWVTSQNINVATTEWDDVRAGASQRGDLDVEGAYAKVEHDFEAARLTAITAYSKTHAWYEEDNGVSGLSAGPNTEALVIDMDQEYKQVSQEFRLASTDLDASFRWIAGVYYFEQDSTLAQNIRFGDNGVLAFNPVAAGIPPSVLCGPGTPANDPNCTDDFPGMIYASNLIPNPYANTASFSIAELEETNFSVYGQGDYDLSDQLTVTLGLRYTDSNIANPSYYAGAFDITGQPQSTYYDKALVEQFASGLPACQPIGPTNPPFQHCANVNTSRADISDQDTGGTLRFNYHFSDATMVYGSYSRGFKSGKHDVEFLHTDTTPFPQRSLDKEALDAYEIGIKSTVANGTLLFNAAAFFYTWDDLQVFNVGSNGPEFYNLPEAEITGVEVEMKWSPGADWLVSAGIGILNSEITDTTGIDFDLGQGEFQKGHELPLTPEFSANFTISKDFDLGDDLLMAQLDGRYQSSSKAKYKPSSPIDEYESRFLLNGRVDYSFGDRQQYAIIGTLENITEEEFCYEKQDLHALVGAYYCVPNYGEMQWGLQGLIRF